VRHEILNRATERQGATVSSKIELKLPQAKIELEGPQVYLSDSTVAKWSSLIDYQ
jgi:hypothetical protein